MNTKGRRSSLKCNQCRIHKCKCDPEVRPWDDQEKRKCERCKKGRHECGPSIRVDAKVAAASTTRQSKRKRPDEVVYSNRNSHQDGEGALCLASEGPRLGERPALTPCKINDKMIELGKLHECMQYLEFQNDAAQLFEESASTLPCRQIDHPGEKTFADVRGTKMQILQYVHFKFGETCGQIIDLFESKFREDPSELLSHLNRLKEHLEAFQSIIRFRNVEEDMLLNSLRVKVRGQLIPLYERNGDAPMVHRLKREIRKLPPIASQFSLGPQPESHPPDIEEFDDLSRRIHQTLSSLVLILPEESKKHLPPLSSRLISPIHEALRLGQTEAVYSMATRQDFGEKKIDLLHRQVIHLAAELADLKLLEIVLDRSPELCDDRDSFSRTPLGIAAFHGHLDACKKLVDAGASLTAKDIFYRSILCVASGAGHLTIVEYLLSKNTNPHEGGLFYSSPLHAAVAGKHEEIVRKLLSHGAIGWWGSGYETNYISPVDLAKSNRSEAIVDMLEKAIKEWGGTHLSHVETSDISRGDSLSSWQ